MMTKTGMGLFCKAGQPLLLLYVSKPFRQSDCHGLTPSGKLFGSSFISA